MPSRSRSVLVVLGAVASVILVVAGASAAAGWGSRDALASGAAPPAPATTTSAADTAPAESVFPVPAPPDAARDPVIQTRAGMPAAQGTGVSVERVDLDAATTVDVRGAARDVSAVYRVTVSAGPYVMRDLPAVLAVDDVPLGVAAESEDLQSLVLYTYDDAVAVAGATLSLSYGLSADAPAEWSTTLEATS